MYHKDLILIQYDILEKKHIYLKKYIYIFYIILKK